jgi:hypothetical protein
VFGCLRNLGCLVLVLVLAALAYLYRDRWLPLLPHRESAAPPPSATAPAGAGGWEALTPAGATRARDAVQSLSKRSGPVYVNVSAGDLASYIMSELARQLPPSLDTVQASVRDNRIYLRSSVRLSDLGGSKALGPLSGLLGEREEMQIGGNIVVVRPGLAEFRIEQIKLRDFPVPRGAIPRLVAQIRRDSVPAGVSADALPFQIPPYIGDVRVNQGRITIYKAVK